MEATGSVKVPDGKLVRVTATYEETIEAVRITGDFFLEPPEARADLEAAIEGLSADASEEDIAAAVETVDAALIGFGPADLAAATREALE
jgi:hypothetical protein